MIKQPLKPIYHNPLEAYEAKQAEIRTLLKQIEQGLQQHDQRARCLIGHHWGHVGDLISIAGTLNDIKDRLHLTGEYANVS